MINLAESLYAYKLPYLKKGVTEHLKAMFHIAVDLNIFTKLPDGVTWDDVEPSLDSLIQKERQRQRSQKYGVVAQMSQPWLAGFQEGLDNFKKDDILRNIAASQGMAGDLNTLEDRAKIREMRKQRLEQEQQNQQNLIQAQIQAQAAQAAKDQAGAGKSRADAEKIGSETL